MIATIARGDRPARRSRWRQVVRRGHHRSSALAHPGDDGGPLVEEGHEQQQRGDGEPLQRGARSGPAATGRAPRPRLRRTSSPCRQGRSRRAGGSTPGTPPPRRRGRSPPPRPGRRPPWLRSTPAPSPITAPIDEQIPSWLSIMLQAFTTATNHTTTRSGSSHAGPMPARAPARTSASPPPASTARRTVGGSGHRSSQQPTAASPSATPRVASTRRSAPPNASPATTVPAATARPPSTGVAVSWTRWPPGWSTKPVRCASRRASGVTTSDTAAATTAASSSSASSNAPLDPVGGLGWQLEPGLELVEARRHVAPFPDLGGAQQHRDQVEEVRARLLARSRPR